MKSNNGLISFFVITVCFAAILVSESHCYGANLNSFIADDEGKPVEYAVVTATPTSFAIKDSKTQLVMTVDQVDKEFIDYVTPIQVGTTVQFPNNDKIRHHIYSFSPAKKFEIPLYPPGANANNKVLFDKPGVVVIGCNIHDWMKAYIYVVETPYFARSDSNGKTIINNLPAGQYDVTVWHPNVQLAPQAQKLSVDQVNSADVKFTLHLTRQWHSRRAPISEGRGGLYH